MEAECRRFGSKDPNRHCQGVAHILGFDPESRGLDPHARSRRSPDKYGKVLIQSYGLADDMKSVEIKNWF